MHCKKIPTTIEGSKKEHKENTILPHLSCELEKTKKYSRTLKSFQFWYV